MRKRPSIILLLAVSLVCIAAEARAQILNIEKRRLERDDADFFTGNVGLRFNYNNRSPTLRQPARVMSTGLTSNTAYLTESHRYLLINDYQTTLINETEIVNAGLSHLRAQFHREETLSYEVFSQYQYDRPRGMTFRGLIGLGPRLRLVQSEQLNLTAGTGVMYERETWNDPESERRIRARFIKSNSYLSVRIEVSEHVDFNGIVYYQVGYDRPHELFRHRVSTDLNLTVKIIQSLSLTSSVNVAYETHPIVPIIPLIYSTMNGIQFEF